MAKKKAKKAKSSAAKKTKKSKKPVKTANKRLIAAPKAKSYKGPKIGDTVTPFEAPATGGSDFNLNELRGKNVVIYFYPKDDTPGCTLEGHDFTKLKNQFGGLSTVVYGLSRDSMESHEKFKEKQCYAVDLISDADEKICKLFDVIQTKNMYGKMVKGIERSTFVIDGNGVLRGEWRKVSVLGHAEEVLQFIKNLSN